MNTLCLRRRKWLKTSTYVAATGTSGVIGTQVWIAVFAPHPLAAIRGVAVLVVCSAIAVTAGIVASLLCLTETPALNSALRLLTSDAPPQEPPALRLVEAASGPPRAATKS